MTIQETQESIINEFSVLDGDQEMTNFYIMDLGQKLPVMGDDLKTEENIVKGCQSTVWLSAEVRDGRVYYTADSNTAITKGLVSLLIRTFSGHTPDEIIQSELFFPERIRMNRFIGTQRSNGFLAMIKQFKIYAVAMKVKVDS